MIGIAQHFDPLVRSPDHRQRFSRQVALRARDGEAVFGERLQVDAHLLERHAPLLPGEEHLLDEVEQAVAVFEHHVVELVTLVFVHARAARLEGLEVKPDRGHRCLQLVRDGVDERVVLLVAPDLANQERRVEDEARDDGGEYQAAEQEGDDFSKGEDHPSHVERNRQRHQTDAEGDEESDDALPAGSYGHGLTIDLGIYRSVNQQIKKGVGYTDPF